MADVVTLKTTERTLLGSANARRLRYSGYTPAVLYGKKRDNFGFSIVTDTIERALRARAKVFQIELPSGTESAMIRELQIDQLTDEILHVDFGRVELDELVEVEVGIRYVGDPKGLNLGGVVEVLHASIRFACEAAQIPDEIRHDVSGLEVGQTVILGDLIIPADSKAKLPADTVVYACNAPVVEAAEEEGDEG